MKYYIVLKCVGKTTNRCGWNMGSKRLKWGWEEQVFFWLDTQVIQDVENNREHAWKKGREAEYPNILILQDIWRNFIFFGKLRVLGMFKDVHDLVKDTLILAGVSLFSAIFIIKSFSFHFYQNLNSINCPFNTYQDPKNANFPIKSEIHELFF